MYYKDTKNKKKVLKADFQAFLLIFDSDENRQGKDENL